MIPTPSENVSSEIARRFTERCGQLGLGVWRLGADGSVSSAPENPDAALDAHALTALAHAWADVPAPEPVRLENGGWVLPFPVLERRARAGHYAAFLPAEPSGASPPAGTVHQLHQTLAWLLDELRTGSTARADLEYVTDQLTDSYESFHSLYEVGRAMGQIDEPDRFVRGLVAELGETLPFAWFRCVTTDGATGDESVDERRFEHGDFPADDADFDRVMDLVRARETETGGDRTIILTTPHDLVGALGPQVIAQPVRAGGRGIAMLVAGSRQGAEPDVTSHETKLIEAAGGLLGTFLENAGLYVEKERTFIGTIRSMTSAIDAKDRYTRGHSIRVAKLSRRIALAAGLDDKTAEQIYISGLVHDVGKIGVPEAVLTKAGRLTDEEFELIKRHPDIGHEILSGIPSLKPILPGVLHHHERWDGAGYPRGLAGADIPLMARVIGLADTFDAMSSTRSYRSAMPRDKVLAEIERCAGTQFDPVLAALMPTIDLSEYDALVEEHRATDPTHTLTAA